MILPDDLTMSRLELDQLAIAIPADRRSIVKELCMPGSVRGRAGERIRVALAARRRFPSVVPLDLGDMQVGLVARK